MAYTLITEREGKALRRSTNSRKQAMAYAAASVLPLKVLGLECEERSAEVVDGKGARLFDGHVPAGSEYALAWEDSKRTWVRGFPTREEAESARESLPAGCRSAVLGATGSVPWIEWYCDPPRWQ